MKRLLATIAIALLSASTTAQTKTQSSPTFFCDIRNGNPVTVARTPGREVTVINWNAPDINSANSSPQELCKQVSEQFQSYYNDSTRYVTTGRNCPEGRHSCQVFACVARSEKEGCRGRFLFPLKLNDSYDTPRAALQRIMHIRVPYDGPIYETPPPVYIDLERYLEGAYPSD